MIVHKQNKTYQTRSDKPDENWLDDDNYCVIDDRSDLANKIIDNYPYVDILYADNRIVDVIVDEEGKQRATKIDILQNEIETLKQKLSETDYKAIKYAEGLISEEEYEPIKAERQSWRDRINELEKELEEIQNGL